MLLALLLSVPSVDAARRPKPPPPPPPPPPKPDGWWDPGRDTWSAEALRTSLRQVEEKPAPSSFLGDTSGLARFDTLEWAWFADGFDPAKYPTVAVAPPKNGMGRFELVGEGLLRDELIGALRGVQKPWRKADAGTDADLVVYTNLRWSLTDTSGVAWVVESLGIDADKNIVFRAQLLAGAAPPPTGPVPDDRTRFGWLEDAAHEAAIDLTSAMAAAAGGSPPHGPAVRLHVERVDLIAQRKEAFGPALTTQITAAVAAAGDTSASVDERVARVLLLGSLGAAAGVPILTAMILDTSLEPRLRAAAVWAAGEIGHPNALPTLQKARGVDPYLVKTAITKIDVY